MAEAEHTEAIAPGMKITGLHIAGYRSIQKLDWPEDGLGWDGKIPDIVLVGGANGSGKTTLLEGLFAVFAGLEYTVLSRDKVFPGAREFCLDMSVQSQELGGVRALRIAVGDETFVRAQMKPGAYGFQRRGLDVRAPKEWLEFLEAAKNPVLIARGVMPRVLYFPTDRQLEFPEPGKRSLAQPPDQSEMAWRFMPATSYEESLINQLTHAKFTDLLLEKEGKPEQATHYAALADAFHRFIGAGKELVWEGGKLFVRTADKALHDLPALSSGEKQVLLFAAELQRRWTPGSLVLIDEPELHLHDAWQSTLFRMIQDLQRERGGQAILTTQSNFLFGLGEPGSRVLLRKGWP